MPSVGSELDRVSIFRDFQRENAINRSKISRFSRPNPFPITDGERILERARIGIEEGGEQIESIACSRAINFSRSATIQTLPRFARVSQDHL
jgi:hypothetical protein